ncbi:preprotein translocase subunit SecE [Demequina sp.]|uniref:preprotein translocase subunit SecE n=1 Tax=Demequina sp. TaxID=2050685 RepID=UPI003A846E8B
MSETAVTDSGEKDPRHESREGRNIFGRIALFVRQVISELKRVVTPTREELIRYIWIVLGFVAVMMVIVFALDWVFNWVSLKVFVGG